MRRRSVKLTRYTSCARETGADYSLGRAETRCNRIVPGQRVQTCVTRQDKPGRQLSSPDDVCKVMRGAEASDRESFYVLYLDAKNRINGIEEAHKGTLTHVEVHPREVFKGALAANAVSVIAAHNHPSGDPSPSQEDIDLTDRLVAAGNLLGIPVLDHIVIGRERCESIRERMPATFRGTEGLKRRGES